MRHLTAPRSGAEVTVEGTGAMLQIPEMMLPATTLTSPHHSTETMPSPSDSIPSSIVEANLPATDTTSLHYSAETTPPTSDLTPSSDVEVTLQTTVPTTSGSSGVSEASPTTSDQSYLTIRIIP